MRLFNFGKRKMQEEETKSCRLCEYAQEVCDEYIICKKKGRITDRTVCRAYSYDIMKKTPAKPIQFAEYEE